MEKFLRKTIKSLYKTGFFHSFTTGPGWLSFKHGERVFSCQKTGEFWLLSSGYVHTSTQVLPTFESDYNTHAPVEVAEFRPDFMRQTDNPDFIRRYVLYLLSVDITYFTNN